MTASQQAGRPGPATPIVIVSCDSHVGPRLREDLREYCPKKYLEQYDAFVAQDLAAAGRDALRSSSSRAAPAARRCSTIRTCRPQVTSTRQRVCERWTKTVCRRGDLALQPERRADAMVGRSGSAPCRPEQWELGGVCYDMYNRWLADFCSADPERLLGSRVPAHVGHRACVAELRAGCDAGAHGS